MYAAEVACRSSRDLGHRGLAQREGARSAEQLLERAGGMAPDEARAVVRMGAVLAAVECGAAADGVDPVAGASRVVAESVSAGSLSIQAADAIVSALGAATDTVSTESLTDAATLLVAVAPELTIKAVSAEARALRDELDTAGVAERELRMRERRYLHLTLQPDGMTRVAGLLDPESAAIVTAAFDQITAPRRSGPRFVDERAARRSKQIVDDPRSNGQLLTDAFVEMVRIAGAADPGRVFVQRRPAVVIRVDKRDLDAARSGASTGSATIDGQTASVSIGTAERFTCSAGAVPVVVDGATTIDVGANVRFHTTRQRAAIAERDRSCLWTGCEHPPSWCEVHHAQPFSEGGPTTVANGVLLCRFHHMHVHDNGWRIEWHGDAHDGGWVAMPAPGSGREPVPLPSKRRGVRRGE